MLDLVLPQRGETLGGAGQEQILVEMTPHQSGHPIRFQHCLKCSEIRDLFHSGLFRRLQHPSGQSSSWLPDDGQWRCSANGAPQPKKDQFLVLNSKYSASQNYNQINIYLKTDFGCPNNNNNQNLILKCKFKKNNKSEKNIS